MVLTPWGVVGAADSGAVSAVPSGAEELAAHGRRERLYAAMVGSCTVRGYEATSVADLLELSGVSRATFYDLFDSKADCFQATIEVLLKAAVSTIGASYQTELPWEVRAKTALRGFLSLVAAQPAAARVCLVDSYAAGSVGIDAVEIAVDRLSDLGLRALESMPGRSGIPEDLARAIIGGFHRVLYTRLHQGRTAELTDIVDKLWDWAMSYPPPPRPLVGRTRRSARAADHIPPFAAADPAERIIRGFAQCAMEKGLGQTTIADIAVASSVSQATIYKHFDAKDDLLSAAIDSSGAQLAAAVLPAIRRSSGWPTSVWAGFDAACRFLAAEPAFAYLREVEVYVAGPDAITMRDQAGELMLSEMLAGTALDLDPIFFEAIAGAAYSILNRQVRRHGPQSLPGAVPLLTYVALAPILGPSRVCEVANSDRRER